MWHLIYIATNTSICQALITGIQDIYVSIASCLRPVFSVWMLHSLILENRWQVGGSVRNGKLPKVREYRFVIS